MGINPYPSWDDDLPLAPPPVLSDEEYAAIEERISKICTAMRDDYDRKVGEILGCNRQARC